MQLVYRGVRYRPAALQLFVARGGWGPEYTPQRERPLEAPAADDSALSVSHAQA